MHEIIDERRSRHDPLVNGLFVERQERADDAASEETGREPLGTSYSATETKFAPSELDQERGEVKWFDSEKGYGWLRRPIDEPDLWVHITDVVEGDPSEVLKVGRKVEYEVGRNNKGPKACRVRPVS